MSKIRYSEMLVFTLAAVDFPGYSIIDFRRSSCYVLIWLMIVRSSHRF